MYSDTPLYSIGVKTLKWHSWKQPGFFENYFTHKFKEYLLHKLSKVSLPKSFRSKFASEGELPSVTPILWSALLQLEPPPPIIITDPPPAPQQWHQKPIELASCISPLQAACLKPSVNWYWPHNRHYIVPNIDLWTKPYRFWSHYSLWFSTYTS